MFQKEFVKKMEKKYPAFKFKVEHIEKDRKRIIVNLDGVGVVEVRAETYKRKERWDSIGKMIIAKLMRDLHLVLDGLVKDSSKTVSEIAKEVEIEINK